MTVEELKIINIDAEDRLKRASADAMESIAAGLDESDSRAMIRGILRKYPGAVLDEVSKSYIHNLATVDVMKDFMSRR